MHSATGLGADLLHKKIVFQVLRIGVHGKGMSLRGLAVV